MSSDLPEDVDAADPASNVDVVRIEDEMEQSYIDYAMSVIAGRALPDVRDGLKPVHRRILYAMHREGVTSSASHRKSSSVVGDTMGDFHPHGDSAIYDTLTRMEQDFSMRYPLVDGQGNFGSVDGDPPAAMRYTEARMSAMSEELLADIEKDTVDFQSNYDDRLEEPTVLPAAFPNLLVNGSSGIAVGMSTNIPPHNLGEIIDATIYLIDNPDCEVADLVDLRPFDESGDAPPDARIGDPDDWGGAGKSGPVRGPDFPTGANILGQSTLHQAYTTGRGRLRVRAEYDVGDDRIVISELPYQENKARLVERIADDVNDGTIEGIRDLRDESDRDGIRIVVELKRDANPDLVENQLLEHHLESTFGVINLALVDGQPQVLDLKETLQAYVDHRREVVRRRSQYDLAEAEDRAHILEGRLTALDHVDEVVDVIQDAADRDEAKADLRTAFDFSEAQVEHIVSMQLGSLTAMEAADIEDEYEDVQATIERLETILGDEAELLGVIKDELREIAAEYDDDRRTRVVRHTAARADEDLIPQEDVFVVVTEQDYVKRMSASQFDPQGRGGKGIIGADVKEGDRVSKVFLANTHDYLLCFTNHGQVYQLKVHEIPAMSRTARGKSAVNVLDLDEGEEITAVVNADDFGDDEFLTMVTRGGYVKRTPAENFENVLSTGIIAANLTEGDALVDVAVTDGDHDLVVATRDGMAIRFAESEARPMGRNARGVHGVKLQGDDAVAGLVAAETDDDASLLTVTRRGYGKRTPLSAYRRQSRYGKGLIDIKTGERNGPVTAVERVEEGDDAVVMTARGQIMRTRVADVSEVGRNTKGVIVMRTEDGDEVASVDVVPPADDAP